MKPKDFRQSANISRQGRVVGSAPQIGRLGRIPGTGLPMSANTNSEKGIAAQKKGKWRQRRTQLRIAFFAFSFVCVSIFVLLLYRNKSAPVAGASEVDEENRIRVVSKFPSPSEADALGIVKAGLTERDPQMVERFFRVGQGRGQEVVDFLTVMASNEGKATDYQWLSSVDANNLSLDGVNVIFKANDKATSRVALLTPDDFGAWKIDFDAFARTVMPGWKSILDLKTQQAMVRVIIAKDSYFNGPFRDEKQWSCYGMASPDTEEVLIGYCKIGSPQEAALAEILSGAQKLKRVTLEIRRLEAGEARQFEISQVIAEDWVATEVLFQANFADAQ